MLFLLTPHPHRKAERIEESVILDTALKVQCHEIFCFWFFVINQFETALMVYSGAWGKLIHEKNQ